MKRNIICLFTTLFFVTITYSQKEIKHLNQDKRLLEIINYSKSFGVLKVNETEKINNLRDKIDTLVKEIMADYGETNVNNYIQESLRQSLSLDIGDGNKCKRNSNGTVNTDACSFWEFIAYVFSAATHCGPGEPTDWYYDCCQAAVCRNC